MSLGRIGSLIRKAIIAVLTVAAVGIGAVCVDSHQSPRSWTWDAPLPVRRVFERSCQKRVHLVAGTLYVRDYELIDGNNTLTPCSAEFAGFRWATGFQRPQSGWTRSSYSAPLQGLPLGEQIKALPLFKKQLWYVDLRVPLWAPFILFATYPTIAFVRGPLRRYRRRKRGLCINCGYDLRGTTGGVCSECGEGAFKP